MAQPVAAVQAMRIYFIAGLAVFAAAFFAHTAPASAQVQTAVYSGPSFDVSWCAQPTGPYPPNVCITGSTSASITYVGACPSASNIISITASNGAGSLVYPGNYFSPLISCDANGQIAGWLIQGFADNLGTAQPYIAIDSGPPGGATDETFYASGCCYTHFDYVNQQGYGHWTRTASRRRFLTTSATGRHRASFRHRRET
jgi:hypothetical protein